ncbi:DUF4199 domain-containing protein [Flavobacterium sp.]|jgi:hypothetical protein|uniref:DUF4199 domain-containing protein n=1 Tax=Flavobacterium sp. TaxID=239 RepID=UPI0026229B9D|nr:DUF4199 domain-containing protein [Flavobacterium sp.]
MKSIIIKFSTIASVIIVVFMIFSTVLFVQLNNDPMTMMVGFGGMLLGFSTIFIALEKYKKHQGGTLSFLDGLKIGSAIAIIGALSYTLVWMLEFEFVFPDFMDKYAASQIEQLKISDLKPDEMADATKKMQEMALNYKNPFYRFAITLYEILPFGMCIALLATLILRKKTISKI